VKVGKKMEIYKADFVLDIKNPAIFTAEQFEDLTELQDTRISLRVKDTVFQDSKLEIRSLLKISPLLKDSKAGADTAFVIYPLLLQAAG